MIKLAKEYYDSQKSPNTPKLRRSSRCPERENKFKEIEDIQIYYETRSCEIYNISEIYQKIKFALPFLKDLIFNKFGDDEFSLFIYEEIKDYIIKPNYLNYTNVELSKNYQFNNYSYLLNNSFRLKIKMDPRIGAYSSMELISFLKSGYSLISSGQKYYLTA